jgi:Chaperone of endosialidase
VAVVTSFTAERMLEIENTTVVDGEVQGDNLILVTREGTLIDAGSVRGPQGTPGPAALKLDDVGDVNAPAPANRQVLAFDFASKTWIPSGLSLDELTNVDATSPTANQVLLYNSGTSRWVLGPPMMPVVGKTDMPGAFTLARTTMAANLIDGTGIIQSGPNGTTNMALSQNVIQVRNGAGAASTLYLNNSGGETRTGGIFRTGDDIIATGGVTCQGITSSGAISGTTITGSGAISGTTITGSGNIQGTGVTATTGNVTANAGALVALADILDIHSVATHAAIFDTTSVNGPYILFRRSGVDQARYGYTSGAAQGNILEVFSINGSIKFGTDAAAGASQPDAWAALFLQAHGSSVTGQFMISLSAYRNTTASGANVNIDASGVFRRSTSSIEFKTDVEPIEKTYVEKILDLNPVWYRSTAPADNPDWSYYGLVAEEVAAVDPRLVSWEPSQDCSCGFDPDASEPSWQHQESCLKPSYVYYERIVPHLISSVKALEARLSALEAA